MGERAYRVYASVAEPESKARLYWSGAGNHWGSPSAASAAPTSR